MKIERSFIEDELNVTFNNTESYEHKQKGVQ